MRNKRPLPTRIKTIIVRGERGQALLELVATVSLVIGIVVAISTVSLIATTKLWLYRVAREANHCFIRFDVSELKNSSRRDCIHRAHDDFNLLIPKTVARFELREVRALKRLTASAELRREWTWWIEQPVRLVTELPMAGR